MKVIANVMPVRGQIEELCIREFMRIMMQEDAQNLRIMLRSATRQHKKFTPMYYIKHLSKDFQEALDAREGKAIDSESVADVDLECGLLGEVSYAITTNACKHSVTKYCTDHWQRKWNITDSRRSTYKLVPTVSQKPLLPSCRNTAVSFVKILLHESNLQHQSYRMSSKYPLVCNCGQIIDDLEHKFLSGV